MLRSAAPALLLALLSTCSPGEEVARGQAGTPGLPDDGVPRVERMERLLGTLAHDSMGGRRTGTPGAAKAARFLAAELERYGVRPVEGLGYLQPVPLARVERNGRMRLMLPSESLSFDTLPAGSVA